MKKAIELTYDSQKETAEAFEARMAEAIVATGEPGENVLVIIREIVAWNPTVDYFGSA